MFKAQVPAAIAETPEAADFLANIKATMEGFAVTFQQMVTKANQDAAAKAAAAPPATPATTLPT